jgi:hypothetical protein
MGAPSATLVFACVVRPASRRLATKTWVTAAAALVNIAFVIYNAKHSHDAAGRLSPRDADLPIGPQVFGCDGFTNGRRYSG